MYTLNDLDMILEVFEDIANPFTLLIGDGIEHRRVHYIQHTYNPLHGRSQLM
jgi:hypothetical protein